MDEGQLAALNEKVNAIKENTDKIPDLAITIAKHQVRLDAMEPRVQEHEKVAQRALTLSAITGLIGGFFSYVIGGHGR